MTYNPKYAWARAFIYFAVCILISYLSGALELVLGSPLVTAEQVRDPKWITLLLASCAVIFISYFIIWPRGTLTHGRRQNLIVVGTFGLLWGLSEGLFFLTVFVLAHKFILPTISASVAAFIIVSTFLGLWHQFYWDIFIAPEHNIPEWNAKKVSLLIFPILSSRSPF